VVLEGILMIRPFRVIVTTVYVAGLLGCGENAEREKPRRPERPVYKSLLEELRELAKQDPKAKREQVVKNMHTLHLVLEEFSADAYGGFPVDPKTTTGRVTESLGFPSRRGQTQTINCLLEEHEHFKNPYKPDLPAFSISRTDPPIWSLSLLGQVIWVPVAYDNIKSTGYKLYGAGPDSLYDSVIKSLGLE
jgi:hypothetical protein